jgi:hypothetical protein
MIAQKTKWSVLRDGVNLYLWNGEEKHKLVTKDPMTAEKICDFWNWRDKKNTEFPTEKRNHTFRPRKAQPTSSTSTTHLRTSTKIKVKRTLTGRDYYKDGKWVVNHEGAMVRIGEVGIVTDSYNGGRDLEVAFPSQPGKTFIVSHLHVEEVGDE